MMATPKIYKVRFSRHFDRFVIAKTSREAVEYVERTLAQTAPGESTSSILVHRARPATAFERDLYQEDGPDFTNASGWPTHPELPPTREELQRHQEWR